GKFSSLWFRSTAMSASGKLILLPHTAFQANRGPKQGSVSRKPRGCLAWLETHCTTGPTHRPNQSSTNWFGSNSCQSVDKSPKGGKFRRKNEYDDCGGGGDDNR